MRPSVGGDADSSIGAVDVRCMQRTLFRSPIVCITELECRPETLGISCDTCPIDNQFVLVRRGGYLRHARGETFVANSNKVLFFKAWEPYRTVHFSLEGHDSLVIGVDENLLGEICDGDYFARTLHLPSSLDIVARGQVLAARIKAGRADALEVEEAVLGIVRQFGASRSCNSATLNGRSKAIVRRAEAILTVEFASPWTLDKLSRRVGRSQFHLVRLFRRATGLPIHRYLMNLRLSAAVERLAGGEENIAMLALDLGFSSHAHFSSTFKAGFGIAPSEFRTKHRWA